jgi:hypothetical protein
MTPEPSQRDDALQRDTVLLGVPPASRKAWLIFSMWMRPSCTASTPLAISISLCAAVVDKIAGWSRRTADKRKRPRWTRPEPSAC